MFTKLISFLGSKMGLDFDYFTKNQPYLSAATAVNIVTGFVLSILFAKFVYQTTFGIYSFIYSLIAILSFTSLLGLRSVLPYAIAKNKDGVFPRALKLSLTTSLLGSIGFIIAAFFYLQPNKPDLSTTLFVAALFFPLVSALAIYPAVLTGKKLFSLQGIFGILQATIPNILIAVVIVLKLDLFWLVFVGLSSQSILNVIFVRKSLGFLKNNRTSKKDMHYGLKLSLLWFLPTAIGNLDTVALAKFLGFEGVSIYACATLLPSQITNFLKNFQPLAVPKISKMSQEQIRKDLPGKSIQFSLFIIPLVLIYLILSPFLFHILYPKYTQSILASQIYSIGVVFFSSSLLTQSFHHLRQFKKMLEFSVIGPFVRIILVLLLVPKFGVIGASWAFVAYSLFEYILALFLLKLND